MGNIMLMMSVSVGGYIDGPNREIDWHLVDDEPYRHFNEQLKAMNAFLSGRQPSRRPIAWRAAVAEVNGS